MGVNESIQYIIDEFEKIKENKSVILMLENVSFDDLRMENGCFLDEDYMREMVYDAEVNEYVQTNCNLRVNNIGRYTMKLIPEELFVEGVGCFTQIKDVERFLSSTEAHGIGLKK